MNTLEEDLVEIIDLLNFTFSSDFTDKWSFKYGKRLPSLFQIKLLKSLDTRKPLKLKIVQKFLTVDSGFNKEVVESFLEDIDYEIYRPIISGSLKAISYE
ncbi:MAG: hypothetical protein CME38_05460 [Haliea sp.]|nr:hypothetical protein [Haliea sp.]|tara:strand:+ start:79 stop:378 length:300 start_codon:yes stop_codon:yes gene_type:complete